MQQKFGVDVTKLRALFEKNDVDVLREMGGVEKVAKNLNCNPTTGIGPEEETTEFRERALVYESIITKIVQIREKPVPFPSFQVIDCSYLGGLQRAYFDSFDNFCNLFYCSWRSLHA